jgi:hypothetical protein
MVRPLRHKENNDWQRILIGAAAVAVLALAPVVLERSARTDAGVSPSAAVQWWSQYIPTPTTLVEMCETSDTACVINKEGEVSFLSASCLQHAGPPTTVRQMSRTIIRELQK